MKVPYVKRLPTETDQAERWITRKSDTAVILDQCRRIVDMDNQCKASGDVGLLQVSKELNTPRPDMPSKNRAYGGGKNSVRSMCEGTVDNFDKGTQYNLTKKTCQGIDSAFKVAAGLFECFEEIEFEEVSTLPKITPPKPTVREPVETPGSTFADFFDIESVTVTYKKKS